MDETEHPINRPWTNREFKGAVSSPRIAKPEWSHAPFFVAAIEVAKKLHPSRDVFIGDFGMGFSSWIAWRMSPHGARHYESNPAWMAFHSFARNPIIGFQWASSGDVALYDCDGDRFEISKIHQYDHRLYHDWDGMSHPDLPTINGERYDIGHHAGVDTLVIGPAATEIVAMSHSQDNLRKTFGLMNEYSSWLSYHYAPERGGHR